MVTDKLTEIAQIQVEAIKGIKIDKVVVWDSLGGKDGSGIPSTAKFMSGMLGALPAWEEMFKSVGFNLADFFKKDSIPEEIDSTQSGVHEEHDKDED